MHRMQSMGIVSYWNTANAVITKKILSFEEMFTQWKIIPRVLLKHASLLLQHTINTKMSCWQPTPHYNTLQLRLIILHRCCTKSPKDNFLWAHDINVCLIPKEGKGRICTKHKHKNVLLSKTDSVASQSCRTSHTYTPAVLHCNSTLLPSSARCIRRQLQCKGWQPIWTVLGHF